MLIKIYVTTQLIQIIHFNEITQYTHMTIVEALLLSKAILHTNEKEIKSYTLDY